MLGKVKRLREAGKRMADTSISRAPFVQGEVRIYGLGVSIMATVAEPGNHVADPLLPSLYDARVVTMHGGGMLVKGEERPQGDAGPAYIQEWSVRFDRG